MARPTGKEYMKGYAKDYCWWGSYGKKCDYDPVKVNGDLELDVDGYTTVTPIQSTMFRVQGGYVEIPTIVDDALGTASPGRERGDGDCQLGHGRRQFGSVRA